MDLQNVVALGNLAGRRTTTAPTGWNDQIFRNSFAVHLRYSPATRDNADAAAMRFINIYLTGAGAAELPVVYLRLLYGMETGEALRFVPRMCTGDTPHGVLEGERGGDHAPQVGVNLGANAAQVIQDWVDEVTALDPEVRIQYVGLLAMICLRYALKDPNVVSRHIVERLKPVFENIMGGNVPIGIAPDRHFAALMNQYFAKGSARCVEIMTLLVSTQISEDLNAEKQKALARAGCLISLRRTGLGMLNWAEKASERLEVGFQEILQTLALRKWVGPINEIAQVLRDYYDPQRREVTWEWCRLLRDSALANISTFACPGLSATLMFMSTDGQDIDNLMQFGQFAQVELERSRLLARACLEILGVDGMAGASAAANRAAGLYRDPEFAARFRPAPPGAPPANPLGDGMDIEPQAPGNGEREY